jgi:hypothetical protein
MIHSSRLLTLFPVELQAHVEHQLFRDPRKEAPNSPQCLLPTRFTWKLRYVVDGYDIDGYDIGPSLEMRLDQHGFSFPVSG